MEGLYAPFLFLKSFYFCLVNTLVNILIRHREGRRHLLERCLSSVQKQSFRNFKVTISVDFPVPDYIPSWCKVIEVSADQTKECYYNLYCNDLKATVEDGWFFFLDDDDYLDRANSLSLLAAELHTENMAVLVQFKRGKTKKPTYIDIRYGPVSGKIGLPCLVLHSKYKDIADIEIGDNGDYKWIKNITKKLNFRLASVVIVNSPQRNYGK